MSSSMQPPDTEPTTRPSSRTASIAPSGRGELPQFFTTVTSITRRPSSIHSALRFNTSRSTLSMRASALFKAAQRQNDDDDGDRRQRDIAYPMRFRRRGGRHRRGSRDGGHGLWRREALCESRKKIVRHFRGGTVDQARADLRKLSTDIR